MTKKNFPWAFKKCSGSLHFPLLLLVKKICLCYVYYKTIDIIFEINM